MSVKGSIRLFALGLGAALLLPALGFAQQPDAAAAQKEKEIAALKARLDELIRQVPAEPTPETAAQMKDLKTKLAQLMKERAGAEFAGYAQQADKERALAELKRIEAVRAAQAADTDKAKVQAELQRAEAILAQKAQEAKELESRIRELQDRIKASAAQVKPGAGAPKDGTTFYWEVVPQQASEEIVLRKVNGKWEVVNSKAPQPGQPIRVILSDKGPDGKENPRITNVTPPVPGGGGGFRPIPVEIRPAPPRSTDARIDELEKKMDKVMQQLEQLTRGLQRSRSAAPGDEAAPRLRIVGDSLEYDGKLKLVPNPEPKR